MGREEDLKSLNFMVSPLTNTIYMTKTKPLQKEGQFLAVETKIDVTNKVVKAVFEWFMGACEEGTTHEISFGDAFGTLTYSPKECVNIKQEEK
jgi:hypothetical protein